MVQKVVNVSGRRKRAIARASAWEGKGIIRINRHLLDTVEPELTKMRMMEPLMIAGDAAKKINIDVSVNGGGFQAQGEASRVAIAKALVEFTRSKQLKQEFLNYDRHLLVSDTRQAETSKPNDSKPRAARQKSYR